MRTVCTRSGCRSSITRTACSPKIVSAPFITRPGARLGARLLPLGERQIDEALDGVHRGHHHPDMGAGAQAPSRALAAPGVTVVLHRSEEHTSELQSRGHLV